MSKNGVDEDLSKKEDSRGHNYEDNFLLEMANATLKEQLEAEEADKAQAGIEETERERLILQDEEVLREMEEAARKEAAEEEEKKRQDREYSMLHANWVEDEYDVSYLPTYDDGYDSNNSQTWDHPDYL